MVAKDASKLCFSKKKINLAINEDGVFTTLKGPQSYLYDAHTIQSTFSQLSGFCERELRRINEDISSK